MPSAPRRQRHKRTFNTRLIRKNYSYDISEITQLFGLHPNSVTTWLGEGLTSIDGHRPTLIHGSDLADFLNNRQAIRKRTCQPNEIYCCRCRVPKIPWENLVDIEIMDDRRLVLKAVCPECGTGLNRIGSVKKLAEYRVRFEIQATTDRRL